MRPLYLIIFFSLIACGKSKIKNSDDLKYQSAGSDSIHDEKVNQPSDDEENITQQLKKRLFKDVFFVENKTLKKFQKKYLDDLTKNGNGEFQNDSSYNIRFVRSYVIDVSDTIFYVNGEFIPSTVDFHFYGGYNNKQVVYEIYHLPIETALELTRYEIIQNGIRVYGNRLNNNFEDEGEILLFELNH